MATLRRVLLVWGAIALAIAWAGPKLGTVSVTWGGYVVETTWFNAFVMVSLPIGMMAVLWYTAWTLWTKIGEWTGKRGHWWNVGFR